MQLSVRHKFAFLCNPKCGSTSVEKAIAPFCRTNFGGHPSLKHLNARKFHQHIRPLLGKVGKKGKIETFCIMREPVARVFSWYQYQSRAKLAKASHPMHKRHTGGISFEQFVEAYLSPKKPEYAKMGTQSGFIRLSDGSIGVDRIFRLDQMDEVGKFLSAKIGKEIQIGHKNKSGKKPAAAEEPAKEEPAAVASPPMEISDAMLARLKEHLADDFEIYNSLL
jgi:hypothetical protein